MEVKLKSSSAAAEIGDEIAHRDPRSIKIIPAAHPDRVLFKFLVAGI
jgi:hypothetical protein